MWILRSTVQKGLSANGFLRESSSLGRIRSFYSSKWTKRLGLLLEKNRQKPPPEIPPTQTFPDAPSEHPRSLRPIKPVLGSKRAGVLAYKLGMYSLWDEWGEAHPITVCLIDRCRILQRKTIQRNGYEAVQMGMGYKGIHKHQKTNLGLYVKANAGPKHVIKEFRVTSDCLLPVGHEMSVRHFVPGQWVFVSGWSKAKGFQGPMRRWGFSGLPATRGVSVAHRSHGSVGQGMAVRKVHKGKKMAGHMGPDPRVTNCRVFRIDGHRNLLLLRGVLPGHKGSVVKISDARGVTSLKNNHIRLPYPTFLPEPHVEYPTIMQQPPQDMDPFLYPEKPLYQPDD